MPVGRGRESGTATAEATMTRRGGNGRIPVRFGLSKIRRTRTTMTTFPATFPAIVPATKMVIDCREEPLGNETRHKFIFIGWRFSAAFACFCVVLRFLGELTQMWVS